MAGLGGYFIARVALWPVSHITRTVQNIGAGDLSRRVTPELRRRSPKYRWSKADELDNLASTFDGMLTRLEEADERRPAIDG